MTSSCIPTTEDGIGRFKNSFHMLFVFFSFFLWLHHVEEKRCSQCCKCIVILAISFTIENTSRIMWDILNLIFWPASCFSTRTICSSLLILHNVKDMHLGIFGWLSLLDLSEIVLVLGYFSSLHGQLGFSLSWFILR